MVGMMAKETSRDWWFDSHNNSKRSPWLQSTLSELDSKTKAMLKVIEEEADSFAQRAEMYYKKRPQLISMVEDFYRTHRSLAERYDLLKAENGPRLVAALTSPFSSPFLRNKYTSDKTPSFSAYKNYDTCSESLESDEYAESEVDDPEQDNKTRYSGGTTKELEKGSRDKCVAEMARTSFEEKYYVEMGTPSSAEGGKHDVETGRPSAEDKYGEDVARTSVEDKYGAEMARLREEMERLRGEKECMKEKLRQKDEEKREAIRQLSMAVEMLKDENSRLKKRAVEAEGSPNRSSPLKFLFNWKVLSGSPRVGAGAGAIAF